MMACAVKTITLGANVQNTNYGCQLLRSEINDLFFNTEISTKTSATFFVTKLKFLEWQE